MGVYKTSEYFYRNCLQCLEDDSSSSTERRRWEGVQNMMEAKVALNFLFQMTAENKVVSAQLIEEIKELQVLTHSLLTEEYFVVKFTEWD